MPPNDTCLLARCGCEMAKSLRERVYVELDGSGISIGDTFRKFSSLSNAFIVSGLTLSNLSFCSSFSGAFKYNKL